MNKKSVIIMIAAAALLAGCGNTTDSSAADTTAATTTAATAAETTTAAPETTTAAPETTTAATTTAAETQASESATQTSWQSAPAPTSGDVYVGTFVEQSSGKGTMEITKFDDKTYSVHIVWPSSNAEINSWDLTGSFDGKGVLSYTNCRKTTTVYDANGLPTNDANGNPTPYTVYSAGAGTITLGEYGMVWNDDMGDIIAGTTFARVYGANSGAAPAASDSSTADTSSGTVPENVPTYNDLVAGSFYDANGGKAYMDISTFDGVNYYVTVTTPNTNANYIVWTFSGQLDADNVLNYTDGMKISQTYDENGNLTENQTLTIENAGNLRFGNTGIVWTDLSENAGDGMVFINSYM